MVRRILSLILLLVMLCAMPAFAKTPSCGAVSVGSGKLKTYVRVFAPYLSTDSGWIGHYDLMIEGTVKFGGKTFVNPCFSYGTDSRLYVFPESESRKVYSGGNYAQSYVYYWEFSTGSKKKLNTFLGALSESVASASKMSGVKGLKCKMKSGNPFAHYSETRVNCFAAVALWMKYLGENKLWNLYTNFYKGGMSYAPLCLLSKYSRSMVQKW